MGQKGAEGHWKGKPDELLSLGYTRCQTAGGAVKNQPLTAAKEMSPQELFPGTEGYFHNAKRIRVQEDMTILRAAQGLEIIQITPPGNT